MEAYNTVDKVPDHLKCPVCIEIPQGKIFQCKSGHAICEACHFRLGNCPQCRAPYGPEPIRLLLLENMLDALKLDCSFKISDEDGCQAKLDRKTVRDHEKSCSFNTKKMDDVIKTMNICPVLGYKDCSFEMNFGDMEGALLHFDQCHHAVISDSRIDVVLHGKASPNDDTSPFDRMLLATQGQWGPIILNAAGAGYSFLVIVKLLEDKSLSWTAFYIHHPSSPWFGKDVVPPCELKCYLHGERALSWRLTPQDLLKAGDTQWDSFPTPITGTLKLDHGSILAGIRLRPVKSSIKLLEEGCHVVLPFPENVATPESVLKLIENRLQSRAIYDRVMLLAWRTLVTATDEFPENCKTLVENGFINVVVSCMETFKNEEGLLEKILLVTANVAEVSSLRPHLHQIIEFLFNLLESYSSEVKAVELSYLLVWIFCQILSDGEAAWEWTTPTRNGVKESIRKIVGGWGIETKIEFSYKSFKPILKLLKVDHTRECQLFAAWVLYSYTSRYPEDFVPLVKNEDDIMKQLVYLVEETVPLEKDESTTLVIDDIKKYAKITLENVEKHVTS